MGTGKLARLVPAIWLALTMGLVAALTLPITGCSSDEEGGGGTSPSAGGKYEVTAGFIHGTLDWTGTSSPKVPEVTAFFLEIERQDASAPGANECTVKIDGAEIPLDAESDADYALINGYAGNFSLGHTYTVEISAGDMKSSAPITIPNYNCDIVITAPEDESEFEPGQPLTVEWQYDGEKPENEDVYLAVSSVSEEDEEEDLLEVPLITNDTSYAISGSVTAGWSEYDGILIFLGLGPIDEDAFDGNLANDQSTTFAMTSIDYVEIGAGGGETDWKVILTAGSTELQADGASQTAVTANVLDPQGKPAPDGTEVQFVCEPSGLGTIDPVTALTSGGKAVSTFTAGTETGTVEIRAYAQGASDEIEIDLVSGQAEAWWVDLDIDPLVVEPGGTAEVTVTVTNQQGGTPCPDGTPVTFEVYEWPGTEIVIDPNVPTTTDGVAHATLTATLSPEVESGGGSITAWAMGAISEVLPVVVKVPWRVVLEADPPDAPDALPADGHSSFTLRMHIEDPSTGTIYTGGTTFVLTDTPQGRVTLGAYSVEAGADGYGQTTVTAGTTPGLIPVLILVSATTPEGTIPATMNVKLVGTK